MHIHDHQCSSLCCYTGSGGLSSPENRSRLLSSYHSIDLSYQVFWTIYSSYREEAQNFNATVVQHNFMEAIRATKHLAVRLLVVYGPRELQMNLQCEISSAHGVSLACHHHQLQIPSYILRSIKIGNRS